MKKKPLHLAIDGNEANVPNRVGSNVYAFEVIVGLEKLLRKQSGATVTVLLALAPSADLPRPRAGWQYQVIGPKPLWTQWALPIHLFINRSQYTVFFTPGHYAPRFCPVPYVSSVMDLAFLYYPEQFKKNDLLQLTNWTAYSVKNASKVIAISEYTKQAVIKAYHTKPSDVVVAYPAVQEPERPVMITRARSLLRKLKVKQPYLLYVGTLQPRKNLVAVIEAFEVLCRQLSLEKIPRSASHLATDQLQLVLAGKVGWLADEIVARAAASPLSKQIILTGYVDDTTKAVLYQHAAGSLLLGLYEGFGIPPLESLHQGTVPLVSNTSSLPEVVGKAGVQVDPSDVQAIAQGMKKIVLASVKERAIWRKAAKHQVTLFSWERTAEVIWNTINSVANHD